MSQEIEVTIAPDGQVTIKGLEPSGQGSKDVHALINLLSKKLIKAPKTVINTVPNEYVEPIKNWIRR